MRVEKKNTEILVHLTIGEAAIIRDELDCDELTMLADLIRREMPNDDDEDFDDDEDDDWDEDDDFEDSRDEDDAEGDI